MGVAVKLTQLAQRPELESWTERGPVRLAASTWPLGTHSGVVARKEPDPCGLRRKTTVPPLIWPEGSR